MKPAFTLRPALLLLAIVCQPALATVATPPDAAATPTAAAWGATGLLQTASGLAVVIALIFLCAWAARRLGLQKHNSGRLVKIVASTALGQRERIVVVEIGGTWLALGVTPGQIQSLHSMPAQELPQEPKQPMRQGALAAGTAASLFAQKLRESLGKK